MHGSEKMVPSASRTRVPAVGPSRFSVKRMYTMVNMSEPSGSSPGEITGEITGEINAEGEAEAEAEVGGVWAAARR